MRRVLLLSAALMLVTSSAAPGQTTPTAPTAPPLTVSELERRALESNPTTRGAGAQAEAVRGTAAQAGAWPNPVVGYVGDELGGNGSPRGSHGFFVEQTIPLGGKLALSRQVFEKAAEQADAFVELQRQRIVTSVRILYAEAVVAERRVEVLERLSALATEAVGVTRQLFNVGAADRPDFLASEIEARRTELDLIAARNDVLASRSALAAMVGDPTIASQALARPDDVVPELEREATLRAVLASSPDIRAARAALERTRAVTARAQRDTYPDLFLRGGAAYNRERGERSFDPVGWEAAVEAGVSVPLFNRNQGGTASARAEEARAAAELQRLELALQARGAATFAEYLTSLRRAETYRTELLPRADEAYRLYLARYKEMGAAYPQVLVAQRTYIQLSAEYLDALVRASRSAAALQGFLVGDGLAAPGLDGTGDETADRPGQR